MTSNTSMQYIKRYTKSKKKTVYQFTMQWIYTIYMKEINDQLFLDTLLMEIRGKHYLTHHTKWNKITKMTQLAANILKLEQNLKEDNLQELEKLKQN